MSSLNDSRSLFEPPVGQPVGHLMEQRLSVRLAPPQGVEPDPAGVEIDLGAGAETAKKIRRRGKVARPPRAAGATISGRPGRHPWTGPTRRRRLGRSGPPRSGACSRGRRVPHRSPPSGWVRVGTAPPARTTDACGSRSSPRVGARSSRRTFPVADFATLACSPMRGRRRLTVLWCFLPRIRRP